MKKIALRSVAAFVSGSMVLLSSCRRKEEPNRAITPKQTSGKLRPRVDLTAPAPVSDHERKWIRSTVESAGKTANTLKNEKSIQEFEQLLQSDPSDLPFLHELALEASSTSQATQEAFVSAIVHMYRAGEYARLGALMDALKTDGVMGGILVNFFTDDLRKQKDLAVRAYDELLANPSKVTHPDFYDNIAIGAADVLGYTEALARIPNIYDGWFGTVAARDIIRNWIYRDPLAASTYVRDLPDSKFPNSMLVNMVEEVADSEDFEMARAWADYLQGDEKIRAIQIVTRGEARIRDRNEQRATREAEKRDSAK